MNKINCHSCGKEIKDNQKWELIGSDYFHQGHNIYHDEIPRCLECGMITELLENNEPMNLRMYCKDCKIVWLLPSNYFTPTLVMESD